jgi:hypothetical protein
VHQHPGLTVATGVFSLGMALSQGMADQRAARIQAAQNAAELRSAQRLARAIRALQDENRRLQREVARQTERAARAEGAFISLARKSGMQKAA